MGCASNAADRQPSGVEISSVTRLDGHLLPFPNERSSPTSPPPHRLQLPHHRRQLRNDRRVEA